MIKTFLKTVLFSILLFCGNTLMAQEDIAALQAAARSFMRQGDFENALLALGKALKQDSANYEIRRDQMYIYYMQRDFTKAIESGKLITARADADEQSFILMGLVYKSIADYKEADKLYKTALKKFPESGLLYAEYGDLLQENKNEEAAIKLWEKGIETDPNISSNYYYASKYYTEKNSLVWAMLYGEIFVNIESLTQRTAEIKSQLYKNYQAYFNGAKTINPKAAAFEKEVSTHYNKLANLVSTTPGPLTFTELRTRFILNWYNADAGTQYPFRLFALHRQLLQDGYFEAYNQWLFGAAIDSKKFTEWINEHAEIVKEFQRFQSNVLFKIPVGQYYLH